MIILVDFHPVQVSSLQLQYVLIPLPLLDVIRDSLIRILLGYVTILLLMVDSKAPFKLSILLLLCELAD